MKKLMSPLWALLTLALLAYVIQGNNSFVESVKLRYFDTLITSQAPTQNNIYTVNIDEAVLERLGQWPLPRTEYAAIIEDLYTRGAGLVVLNVMMPDADRSGGDQVLSETMQEYPVILPSVPSDFTRNSPRNPGAAIINSDYSHLIVNYPGIIANVEILENSAAGVGIVSTMPEIDGVNRRLPLVVAVDGVLYPSMSLEVLRIAAGDPSFQIRLNELGVDRLRIPAFNTIPTDELGRVWIDFSQKNHSVSLDNLPEDFYGAVVIIGPTAAGIANPVPTAVGAVFPQDLQAAVIGTMFNGVNIQRPAWAPGVELLAFVAVGLLIVLLSRWTFVGLVGTAVGIVSFGAASYYYFLTQNFLIDAVIPTVAVILVALHTYGIKFVREFLEKQAIKKQFEGYASPTVVKLLQENPDIIKKGTRREVSICFSDLRGFTPLGESFGDDVAGLTKIMNGYMDAITQPVLEADGMIIKYIGDASMHIHNAPIDDPDHPKTAVATGLKMLRAVEQFNKETIIPQGRPPVGMGAGINTGLGYIGEMGSTKRHSYDVLGDAVSTTARIESKCKEYGCLLLVGAATVEQCQDDFFFLKIDDLAVKGKSVGVGIYTVFEVNPLKAQEYYSAKLEHNRMHELYRSQKFTDAIKLCKQLKGEFDGQMDKYYDMWIERCEFQKTQKLPKDWSGVYVATSK
jgi:adenylate cyclase